MPRVAGSPIIKVTCQGLKGNDKPCLRTFQPRLDGNAFCGSHQDQLPESNLLKRTFDEMNEDKQQEGTTQARLEENIDTPPTTLLEEGTIAEEGAEEGALEESADMEWDDSLYRAD